MSFNSRFFRYKNVISFGDYGNSGVIGVTSIWLKRTGRTRQIVEFDILFNTDYIWGDASIDPTKMDLQNIATHELARLHQKLGYVVKLTPYSRDGGIDIHLTRAGENTIVQCKRYNKPVGVSAARRRVG